MSLMRWQKPCGFENGHSVTSKVGENAGTLTAEGARLLDADVEAGIGQVVSAGR